MDTPPVLQGARLAVHPSADAFLGDAAPELEREEARHSLMLGVATASRASTPPPWLATVRDGRGLALAALMSHPSPLLLASPRDDAGAAVEALAAELRRGGAAPTSVHAAPALAESFAALWSRTSGRPSVLAMCQRLYSLTRLLPLAAPGGRLRRAGPADLELVAGWIAAFDAEALGESSPERARASAEHRVAAGEIYLWEDAGPRAMAARARPTRRSVTVNAVYTPPEQRGHGFATAAVHTLTRELLDEGFRECVLFTDLSNPTSNSIYSRIGYRPVADFELFRFLERR